MSVCPAARLGFLQCDRNMFLYAAARTTAAVIILQMWLLPPFANSPLLHWAEALLQAYSQ